MKETNEKRQKERMKKEKKIERKQILSIYSFTATFQRKTTEEGCFFYLKILLTLCNKSHDILVHIMIIV